MSILTYLKKNGIGYALQVVWRYKLPKLLNKMVLPFVKGKPLHDTIVIESHNDFDCNGGAFYDYLLKEGYNRRYKIVWLLKNKKPGKLPRNVKAVPLYGPSIRKSYYICTAKYLLSDNVITDKNRPEQISLFCNHGAVSLKSVHGLYNVPDDVDYLLTPSVFFSSILAHEYSVTDGTRRFVCMGYPFHDVFYRETPDELDKLTTKKYEKVFLWMPTFRKGGGYKRNDSEMEQPFGVPLIETEETFAQLQTFLEEHNCLLIIKIHPMQDPATIARLQGSDNIIVLTGTSVKELGIDNYRLVKSADALISDYSSIAFSYMLLDRPVGFVLEDQKAYTRGFITDNIEEYLAGAHIYNFREFLAFLESVQAGEDTYGDVRRTLAQKVFTHHDGESCRRIAELLKLEK